jgi:hypothetical protein
MRGPIAFIRAHPYFVLCGLLIETLWLLMHFNVSIPTHPVFWPLADLLNGDLATMIVLMQLFLYWTAYRSVRDAADPRVGKAVWAFSLAFIATLLFIPPVQTTDVYAYGFYGRALPIHGVDPYEAVAADLPHDEVARAVAPMWQFWRNPYGPLWTLMSMPPAVLAGGSGRLQALAFGIVCTLFFLATAALLPRLRAALDRPKSDDRRLAILYLWNPVMLYEFVNNGHNDIAMIFFVALAFILIAERRYAGSAAALAASMLIKYATVVLLPVFALYLLRVRRERIEAMATFAASFSAAAAAVLLPFIAFSAFGEGVRMQAALFNESVSSFLPRHLLMVQAGPSGTVIDDVLFAKIGAASRAIFAGAYFLLCAYLYERVTTPRRLAAASIAAFLLFYLTAILWLMPWYYLWIVPLLIAMGSPGLAAAVSAMTTLGHVHQPGVLLAVGLLVIGCRAYLARLRTDRPAPALA